MTTTLKPEAIVTNSVGQDYPVMLVLQPAGRLDQVSSPAFQQALEQALNQVSEAVIVDLLWVESVDAEGVLALLAGIKQAAKLGKFLTFQAMDRATRNTLTEMWNQQQGHDLSYWDASFEKGLESYLDQLSP
jgi:anti-anti-sigma regulatory factor